MLNIKKIMANKETNYKPKEREKEKKTIKSKLNLKQKQ